MFHALSRHRIRTLPRVGGAALAALLALTSGALAATGRITVDVNGQKRAATIVEHARLKRAPRPTIIVLRNGAGAARRIGLSRVDRFLGLDDAAGPATVLAFPFPQDSAWRLDADKSDDAMVRALAAKLVADGIADRRRIYLAGVSSGGLLALRILCDGADYIAGAAVLIANAPTAVASACKPARPIPFLFLTGTADPLMPFNGGETKLVDFKGEVVSAEATVAPFAAAASCGKNKASQEMPDRDRTDGSRVVVEHFYDCKTPVEIWRVDGGGHALPGRPIRADRGAIIGARNNDIDTSRVLIDFFRRVGR